MKYFDYAEKLAWKSESRFRLGAVLVRGHKVIGEGVNDMYKSHPKISSYAPESYKDLIGTHAEFSACIGLRPYDIGNRARLFIYRLKKNDNTLEWGQGLAKPCEVCLGFLKDQGVKKIFYTLDLEGYGEIRLH